LRNHRSIANAQMVKAALKVSNSLFQQRKTLHSQDPHGGVR
jgi:hypothetical protein